VREKVRQKCKTPDGEAKLLRQTFQFFDTDESGAVTIDEFGRAMERLGYVFLLRCASPDDRTLHFIFAALCAESRCSAKKPFVSSKSLTLIEAALSPTMSLLPICMAQRKCTCVIASVLWFAVEEARSAVACPFALT
jgi:hypothetical protein